MSDEPRREQSATAPPPVPERLIVGQVVAPFGVRGELKVNILTDFPQRFRKLEEVFLAPFDSIEPGLAPTAALDPASLGRSRSRQVALAAEATVWKPPASAHPFKIEATHLHKGQLLLQLEGVDTIEQAEALRGYWLLVPLEGAVKLPRGSYYIYQLVGLKVYTEAHEFVGTVDDVLTTSANDVYVVRGPGVNDPTGELLVPAVKPVVKRMELKRGRIVIADPREWS